MIRLALIVLVSAALLAVALPALDDARTTTTVERLDAEGERIERTAAALAAGSVAVDDPTLAARSTVRVTAPSGLAAARIERLVIGDPTDITDGADFRPADADTDPADVSIHDDRVAPDVALVYRLADGRQRTVPIHPSSGTVSVRVVDGPIELRTGGHSRIELRLVDESASPTIRIVRTG